MTIKKSVFIGVLFLVVLLGFVPFISAALIERGSYWNKFDNGGGIYSLKIYNSLVNFDNDTELIPIDNSIISLSVSFGINDYIYGVDKGEYQAYFKETSDWNVGGAKIAAMVKDDYILMFTPAVSSDRYINFDNDCVGSNFGRRIASKSTTSDAIVVGNQVTYPNQFKRYQQAPFFANLTYKYLSNRLKEELVIWDKDWLQTRYDNCYDEFNLTVDMEFTMDTFAFYQEDIGGNSMGIDIGKLIQTPFKSFGSFDDSEITTSDEVHFTDSNGDSVYYIPKLYAYDSNGSSILLNKTLIMAAGGSLRTVILTPFWWLNDSSTIYPIYIDPSVEISGGGGGGDAYVGGGGDANKNLGTATMLKTGSVARAYLMFNISAIPSNQRIDDASLCLYVISKKNQLVNVSHNYVGIDESTITWNNQPCGTGFDNSANCNLTSEDAVQIDGSSQNTWKCWNTTSMVGKSHDSGSENVSMVLHTTDSDINQFNSKESGDSSLWPYLNITYNTANDIPVVSSMSLSPVSPNTTSSLNCSFTITDGDVGDSLSVNITWYKNNVFNVSYNISITNGIQSSRVLGSDNTTKGNEWNCTIVPYDTKNYGDEDYSSVTIGNIAPSIEAIPDKNADSDVYWGYDANASDIDVNESVDTLTWDINNSMVDINSGTGVISDTPSNSDEGVYVIEVNVTDGTSVDTVTFTYTVITNKLPNVTSLTLTPSSPNTTNNLNCSFTITDGDAGDSLEANVTWYKDGVVDWNPIISVTNGVQAWSSFDSSNTAKGEVWNCTVIPYDGGDYGIPTSENVIILNSPPTTPDIYLDPASPYTDENLDVEFNSASTDDDDDTITYTYRWYKDGVLQPGKTNSFVLEGSTSKNESWLVNVTASDDELATSEKDTDTVTIQNSLPTIDSASIVPTTAYETSTLTASASGWEDLDLDTEGYTYQWFDQNGKIDGATSPTLTGADFNKGDQIRSNVTPWDSEDLGISKLSNIVTILNSLPVLTVSLVSELGFNGLDEDLIGSFSYSDGDSDAITNNETKWFKNSVEQTNLADLTTISYTNTSADDVWVLSARANDGDEFGNWFNSSPLTILDISQTNPVLLIPANGTYFNVSSVRLRYVTPNYVNMNCTIYADNNTDPTTAIKNDTNIPTRTPIAYTWENLQDDMYYWKAGCTNNGELFNSTIKAFTVDTTYPTTAPTLTSVSDSDDDGNIELSWTVDSDAVTYNIYRGPSEILDVTGLTATNSVSGTSWEDNTTLHDNTYWYALTTVDGAGNENMSVVSDSFNATANDTIRPKLSGSVNATSLNGVTTIYWSKVVSDVDGNSDESNLQYKVWYRQNSTVNLSKILVNETADYVKIIGQDSCSGDSCSTTHSLSGSAMYYYFVTTIDDGGNENLTLENNYANLTATAAPPGGDGNNGGSGGGGGGGSSTNNVKKDCNEDWSCSGWYSCVNDVQARTCVDINGCGTNSNKPEETRDCGDCIEEWQCGDWTACVNNKQTKVCIDKNDCKTEMNKPEEENDCNLDTCSDGVKNYGEVGADCGGPCRPCKVSDFITGGAVALTSTKGPNRRLLIPTMLLLVAFLVIKTLRKSNVKFVKIASMLRIPMMIAIVGLFVFSFFGPQITGLFVADDEMVELEGGYSAEDTSEPTPEITGLSSSKFDQRKGRIVSMVFFVIISLVLSGLFVRKRFPDKFNFGSFRIGKKEEIMLSKEQIDMIEEDIKKSARERPLVEDVLEGFIDKKEEPFDRGVRKPNKQDMINDIKNIYK